MVQAYASKDRVSMASYSNDQPCAETIRATPISAFLLSDEDEGLIKEELSTAIKRILTSHIPCFSDLKDKFVWSIPHIYQAESSKKSDIVSKIWYSYSFRFENCNCMMMPMM